MENGLTLEEKNYQGDVYTLLQVKNDYESVTSRENDNILLLDVLLESVKKLEGEKIVKGFQARVETCMNKWSQLTVKAVEVKNELESYNKNESEKCLGRIKECEDQLVDEKKRLKEKPFYI